jgi:hypothetical protein
MNSAVLLFSRIPPAVASSSEISVSDALNYSRTIRRIARFGLRTESRKPNRRFVPSIVEGPRNNAACINNIRSLTMSGTILLLSIYDIPV